MQLDLGRASCTPAFSMNRASCPIHADIDKRVSAFADTFLLCDRSRRPCHRGSMWALEHAVLFSKQSTLPVGPFVGRGHAQ
jgi:hypothetical protein